MKRIQNFPHEIEGSFIDDKTNGFYNPCFKWKVDITYIPRQSPNFKFHSKIGGNSLWMN